MPALLRTQSPPGPPQHWLFGNLKEFSRDQLGTLTRWAREYGDLVSARFGPRRVMFANHPDFVEQVLAHQHRKFIKHYRLRKTGRALGQGLVTSEGALWRSQRKLAQPAFHRERINRYAQLMVAFTERMLTSWAGGQIRDVHADMMKLTLDIVCKTLFDAEIGGESAGASVAMETLERGFIARTGRLLAAPFWFPSPLNVRLGRAVRQLERIILSIIAERRKSGEDRGDLLSMLLHAQDEDSGRGMSDQLLRDEVMTLFMAGHETTANTLAWVWLFLARHPEVEARLHAELALTLGGRPPTFADLPRLSYAEHIVTETLRVYPTVWTIGREAVEPVELGGYRIPAGMTIFMPQWVIHRDARWYGDPEQFRPERWTDGLMQRIPRYAYFPFGGGPRICIGNNFAMMEATLILATIAQKYRMGLTRDAEIKLLPSMTLRPAHGIKVALAERHY